MISKRQFNILKELLNSRKYYPVKHFADIFQVSDRTIHFDLEKIEPIVEKFRCQIVKKPGKGILLKGKCEDKYRMLESVKSECDNSNPSPIERQMQILEKLINEEHLSYNTVSEEYLVSRTSIAKDFQKIKEACAKENIMLKYDNDGTYIVGSEKHIQNLLKKLYLKKFELNYYRLPNNLIEYKQFLLDTENRIPGEFVEETFNIVYSIGEKYHLADPYLISLQNTLIILCMRVFQGKHHDKLKGYVFEQIQQLKTYFIANEIAEDIHEILNLSLSEEDIVYINENLIAYGIENLNVTSNQGYYSHLAKKLVKKFGKIVKADLSNDKRLYKGLLNHIVPMIYRLNNNIRLQNPLIKEIKKQYSVMFNVTWFALVELESELGVHIPEDEIGFIMVHFQSALERNKDFKTILIVCPTGIVTSELLETRIRKGLPSLNLYEVVSVQNIDCYNLEKFDYIISTIPLQIENYDASRIFYISPVPTDKELKEITDSIMSKHFAAQPYDAVSEVNSEEFQIHSYMDLDSIFVDQNFSSMEDALLYLLKSLEEKGIVSLEYRKSVFEREATSSTSLETGVAIPHGNPDYVKRTNITILVNRKKIYWGKEKVDIIIFLSVAKKDINIISPVISKIYDVISDRKQIENILLEKTSREIYEYFQ